MIEVGRICVKIAGRDAARKCVVVDILDNRLVMIDGETRRRKCSIMHLEPTGTKIELKKGASHEEVKAELAKIGITTRETKPKKAGERPRSKRKTPEELRKQKEEKKKFRLFSRQKADKKVEEKKKEIEEKKKEIEEKLKAATEEEKGEKKKEAQEETKAAEKRKEEQAEQQKTAETPEDG
jgi:large subunit ribosomal protein L14e